MSKCSYSQDGLDDDDDMCPAVASTTGIVNFASWLEVLRELLGSQIHSAEYHKAMIRDPRGIDNRSERNVKIVLILPTAMSLFCCASILSNQTSKSILSAEIQKEKEKRLIMIRNRCRCGMNISD